MHGSVLFTTTITPTTSQQNNITSYTCTTCCKVNQQQWYPDFRKDVTWCVSLNYFQLFGAKSNFPGGIKGLINGLDHPIATVQALCSHNIVYLCLTCSDDKRNLIYLVAVKNNTDLTKCTIPITYAHSSLWSKYSHTGAYPLSCYHRIFYSWLGTYHIQMTHCKRYLFF